MKKYTHNVFVPWSVFKPLTLDDGTLNDDNPLMWCVGNFGPAQSKSRWKYEMNSEDELEMTFLFTDDKDATHFILRWL
jgi:hypothetical protein